MAFVNCETCGGLGKVMVSRVMEIPCDTCRGKGGFEIPKDKKLCPQCKGGRKIFTKTKDGFGVSCACAQCFATGFVDK